MAAPQIISFGIGSPSNIPIFLLFGLGIRAIPKPGGRGIKDLSLAQSTLTQIELTQSIFENVSLIQSSLEGVSF